MGAAVNNNEAFNVEEAASFLDLSERRVRKFCAEGRLGQRFGKRSYLITKKELVDFSKIDRPVGNPGKSREEQPSKPRKRRSSGRKKS